MAQATTLNYYKVLGVTQKTSKADLKKSIENSLKNIIQIPTQEASRPKINLKSSLKLMTYSVMQKKEKAMTASVRIRKDLPDNQKDNLIGTHLPVVSGRDPMTINRDTKNLLLRSLSQLTRICQRVDSIFSL